VTRPDVARLLRPAEVLLVVPPFAWQDRPAIGVHLLQAVARSIGVEIQVLYTSFLFARFFDQGTHDTLAQMQYGLFLGERMFARSALGGPALGRDGGDGMRPTLDALAEGYRTMGVEHTFTIDAIRAIEARIPAWLDTFCPAIADGGFRIVGCTSSFEQNLASVAILDAVKARRPEITTIMGGANCEAEMAEGVASLSDRIDHVFSGESEATFRAFLEAFRAGDPAGPRIVRGQPCHDLDALPAPDYADYFDQIRAVMPDGERFIAERSHLTYETSRGCWWGQKSHCTFCGLNGQGMASREKSPDRVVTDLRTLAAEHQVQRVAMTDNIMPHSYFRTLLPRLADELPGMRIMYEEKANLSLRQVRALVAAGIDEIQPGIEALSTGLLKLMAKGTTAAQNIALLRYARAAGLFLQWNLLYGFPGDDLAFYTETLELLPLLCHLQPPVSPCPVVFDRFSPYFNHPERYGIRDLRPFGFYRGVLPESAPLDRLAYHFEGTFTSAVHDHPEVVRELGDGVAAWRRRFYSETPPELKVVRRGGALVLVDRRGLPGMPEEEVVDEARVAAALVPRSARGAWTEPDRWALERRLVVERDRKLVPLAIAEPALLAEIEDRHRRSADLVMALAV
jgi:ribosomal peptide maturation radical SAM protein 1